MCKVKINVIGLQPTQRFLGRPRNVGGRQPFAIRRHFHADLGGDHDILASGSALQPIADDCFRFAAVMSGHPHRIHIGGINEIESGADQCIQHLKGRRFVRCPSKYVAAEAKWSDPQTGTA